MVGYSWLILNKFLPFLICHSWLISLLLFLIFHSWLIVIIFLLFFICNNFWLILNISLSFSICHSLSFPIHPSCSFRIISIIPFSPLNSVPHWIYLLTLLNLSFLLKTPHLNRSLFNRFCNFIRLWDSILMSKVELTPTIHRRRLTHLVNIAPVCLINRLISWCLDWRNWPQLRIRLLSWIIRSLMRQISSYRAIRINNSHSPLPFCLVSASTTWFIASKGLLSTFNCVSHASTKVINVVAFG